MPQRVWGSADQGSLFSKLRGNPHDDLEKWFMSKFRTISLGTGNIIDHKSLKTSSPKWTISPKERVEPRFEGKHFIRKTGYAVKDSKLNAQVFPPV